MQLISVALLLAAVQSDFSRAATDHWRYHDPGEKSWPQLCRTGSRQSPIDIRTSQVADNPLRVFVHGPLSFSQYENVLVSGENTGHTIKFSVMDSNKELPQLRGSTLGTVYVLDSFHFHWFSEHTVDGKRYPMEIHLVHRRIDLDLENSKKRSDGLVVIGVFVEYANKADDLIDIIKDVNRLSAVNSTTGPRKINLRRLMSPNLNSFYTYAGSLTTPDCEEVVTWIIQKKPITMMNNQYELFRKADVGTALNYRALQKINSRIVLATKD